MATPTDGGDATPKQSGQPDVFKATGLGLANKLPDFQANEGNANASLEQTDWTAPADRPWLGKIYLFVNSIESGYTLRGLTSQARMSRTFSPQYMAQKDIIIQGQMANQFEYDKLVEFCHNHHYNATSLVNEVVTDNYGFTPLQVHHVIFRMWHPANGYHHLVPTKLGIIIPKMDAGHERFRFAPAFTIIGKVVWDYLQRKDEVDAEYATTPTGGAGTEDFEWMPGDVSVDHSPPAGVPGIPNNPIPKPPPQTGGGGIGGVIVGSSGYAHPTGGAGYVIKTPAQHSAGASGPYQNTGYDIAAPEGTPIYAVEDGKIPHAYESTGERVPGETVPPGAFWFSFDGGKMSGAVGSVTFRRWFYANVKDMPRMPDGKPLRHVLKGQLIGYVAGPFLHFGGSDRDALAAVVG